MQNLFEGWRKFLIVEGRKQNAAVMIIKKVNDPDLQDILATEMLDAIIAADPTPNKKYIEWGARRMSEAAQKAEELRLLQNFQTNRQAAINNLSNAFRRNR